MKTPTEYDIERLMHEYDPKKAHDYYLRTRKLKGRQPGRPPEGFQRGPQGGRVASAPTRGPRGRQGVRAHQKKQLAAAIKNLENKLQKLEELIRKKEHEEASQNRKGKAKKERAAKEKDKPKSAAEKAKAARENKKFRDKHKQQLKTKAKAKDAKSGSGGGSSKGKTDLKKTSVSELKSLATKVRGQVKIAKQKLAAL